MQKIDIKPFLDVAETLVVQDETERALLVLENLPAYFRDFPPPEVVELKRAIMRKIFTNTDYATTSEDDLKDNAFAVDYVARAMVLRDELANANSNGITPHIVDFGAGDYFIPIGLKNKGLKFTYRPIALQNEVMQKAKEILDFQPDSVSRETWFVAYEVIEHLHYVDELRKEFDRIEGNVTKVFLSTPKYCFGEGNPTWRERGCPHLRAYTPKEFINEAQRLFFEFKNWQYVDNEVMVLKGEI